MTAKKVWFVTGSSKGLGRALVKKLIEHDYPVAAAGRSREALIAEFGEENERFLPLKLDVTNESEVNEAVKSAVKKFGRLDVLVNNAGFTHLASIEEMSSKDTRALFDVNVFGLLNVTRAVLPVMREQKSGHIFNVSSLGAYNTGPLSGIYCATKHAVKAISETLAAEVHDFGIHVTDVKPGFMRTEFFGASYKTTSLENSPYRKLYDENMKFYMGQNGKQAGDPDKAAELYIHTAEMEEPYESLPMGTDSASGIMEICEKTAEYMKNMKKIAASTDF